MRGARQIYEEGATHTRVRLTFYSHEGDGFSGVVNGEHPEFGKIMGVTTTKQMGAPKGTFTITFKKPQEAAHISGGIRIPGIGEAESLLNLWRDPEGVWVFIQWVCDGEVIDGMLGMIDAISEGTNRIGAGAKAETYTISGSDFGKVFETTVPYVSLYDDPARVPLGPLLSRLIVGFRGGAPGMYVEALIEAWIGNYENRDLLTWLLPSGLGPTTFYDMLRRQIGCQVEGVDGLLQNPNLVDLRTGGGQNLWGLMTGHANLLMNEMYCDLAPPADAEDNALSGLVPTVHLRRKPFKTHSDTARWDSLFTHDLKAADIQGRNIAKGGPAQRFNYWTIQLSGQQNLNIHSALHGTGPDPGYPGSYPIWNLSSIEKHGFRLWHQSSSFVPVNAESAGDIPRMTANWLRRCHDWHSVGLLELSGNLGTSRIRPEIRIGQKVKEHHTDGRIEYYVEGVSNSWTYGGAGQTKLTVTRGEYEHEDLLEVVYEELNSRNGVSRALVEVSDTEEITGEGLVGEDIGGTTSESGTTTSTGSRAFQQALQDIDDWLSPSEADAQRALDGQPERTASTPEVASEPDMVITEDAVAAFDQEALENGDPIPVDDTGGDFNPSNDPLYGLDLENLGP